MQPYDCRDDHNDAETIPVTLYYVHVVNPKTNALDVEQASYCADCAALAASGQFPEIVNVEQVLDDHNQPIRA